MNLWYSIEGQIVAILITMYGGGGGGGGSGSGGGSSISGGVGGDDGLFDWSAAAWYSACIIRNQTK